MPEKAVIIVHSYHHKNTEKVAKAMAGVLGAEIKAPKEASIEDVQKSSLIGIGSGIDSGNNYKPVIDFAEKLPSDEGRRAFIFSTYGAPEAFANEEFVSANHKKLREVLESKGYKIVGQFACPGYDTNSFLKYLGGISRGRPNEKDLKRAEKFARDLI